jgi:hypothetical protein
VVVPPGAGAGADSPVEVAVGVAGAGVAGAVGVIVTVSAGVLAGLAAAPSAAMLLAGAARASRHRPESNSGMRRGRILIA